MKIRLALAEQSQRNPDSFGVLSLGREPLTYTRLLSHCDRVIADLNGAGISRGDRVAVVLPNGPEMAVCFLAVAMGASCAPLNPLYREPEFEFYLSDLAPRALIVEEGTDSPAIAVARSLGIRVIRLKAATDDAAGIFTLDLPHSDSSPGPSYAEEGDEALVLHTSGTTARPKMVPLTQANLTASARSIAASLGLDASDRCLNVMPLFHIHGLVGALLTTMVTGGSIVCTSGFQAPRFLDWCDEFAPTWYTAVPTMHQAVLSRATENPARVTNAKLRFIRSCSAPLPPKLMAEMEQAFRVPVLEAYGMTEASHQIATNPPPPAARKPGSVGLASGTEVAVMDGEGNLLAPEEIGEIVLRGPGVTAGYANNPDANRTSFTNSWFRTGDNGKIDREGYLFITGRLKEIINRGGQKISPREIDEVLGSHPAVANAVAFAIPDNRLGEDVAAAVVLRPGHAASEIEIRNHAADRVAQHKVPCRIIFLDELPKGPTGKLQRIGLAAQLGLDGLEADSSSSTRPKEYVAPSTPTEKLLTGLWEQLLGVERIGAHDDFLSLGGDSMLAALIIARIREATGAPLSILAFFENPTIAELAGLVDRGGEDRLNAHDPIVASSTDGDLPLSSAQRRMWFLAELEENSTAYNRSNLYRIRGPLDPLALGRALSRIVERHAVLRTVFQNRDGDPVQIVKAPAPIEIANLDFSQAPEPSRIDKAVAAAVEASNRPFDLARDTMLRPLLIELGESDHLLLLTMHHIASDGWSAGVLMRELSALYASELTSNGARAEAQVLKPLAVQYFDFARWQSQAVRGPAMQESLAWWHDRLQGAPPLLALPTDRSRPPRPTFSAGAETFIIPGELVERLKGTARGERATLFMALLAGFQTLLHRYTGSDDIVVGAFIAGRTRAETEGLIGLFSNTLAMRGDLTGDPTFRELLRKTRDFAFEAYGRQDVPFDMLVESIHPERNLSYQPIVQVTFQVRNYPLEDTQLAGLAVEEVDFDPGTPFDLSFEVTEKAGGLFCKLIYNRELFDRETIVRMAGHFQTLLDGIAAEPEMHISRIPMLTSAERNQLIVEWNDTRQEYQHECVHRLFEAQVERTPDAVAVSFESEQLTYAQLDARANQLAHQIRAKGAGEGDRVAIYLERSLDLPLAVLAVLKAGCVYVPLDPIYPDDRVNFILDQADVRLLLTQTALAAAIPSYSSARIFLDAETDNFSAVAPSISRSSADLAYIIYTSGSTGRPKGVEVTHRSFVNLLLSMARAPGLDSTDVLLALTTIAFDIAGLELMLPLAVGARVVIASREMTLFPAALIAEIERVGATVIQATPTTWRMLADLPASTPLKMLCGGEALPPDLAARLLGRPGQLWNMYGPTETTIWSAVARIERADVIAIGRPIANTQFYVLDENGQPVPVGVAGELYIGGDGVARGYFKRPDLTDAKFVPDPFSGVSGARMYRTGDLVRYRASGRLEFLGRFDSQVKLRGYRIELGEIESALGEHPAVREAAVVAQEHGGDRRLVGYVAARSGSSPSASELRSYLKEKLPEYMVPGAFAIIETLPLTPNGKIDRANLPPLDATEVADHLEFVAPRDEIERRLQTIWEELLNTSPIGIHDDFFVVGGHSLLAARLLARIHREFNCRIPLVAMFPAATIARLAELIDSEGENAGESVDESRKILSVQSKGSRPPIFMIRGFTILRDLSRLLGAEQPIYSLLDPETMNLKPPYDFKELAKLHLRTILDVRPHGPYVLAGYSAGGPLAYEIAQQLIAGGRQVPLLVLFDSSCPVQPIMNWAQRMLSNGRIHLRALRSMSVAEYAQYLEPIIDRRIQSLKNLMPARLQRGKDQPEQSAGPDDDPSQAFIDASHEYRPHPYPCRVVLFKRTRWISSRFALPDNGWGPFISGEFEVNMVPGDHYDMFVEPGVQIIADKLANKLAAAMREAAESVDSQERVYPGHTIALPQIEARLSEHSGVSQATVTVSKNASGDEKLVAYLVPAKDYLESELAAEQNERIEEWRTVFDFFQKDDGSSSASFNTPGWNSSYTKRPIPADEMREWVDNTVEEILSLHPAEVLEVGCGTGLLLLRIAPTSKRYVGTDFSTSSLKSLGKQMEVLDGKQSAVTLLERPADDFKDLDDNSFDTVIINSVVQYFPSLEYLTKVLDSAIKATKPGGAIFVGDVRSLPLLEAWSASVELFHAPSTLHLADLREEIRRRVNQERELLISPAFFLALRRRYPQISRVEIRPKWGKADNEMNSYRYNATLFVDSHEPKYLEHRWLDWNSDGLTLDALRDLLQSGTETLAIEGVVNARIEKDVEALARLANSDDSATVGDLRESLSNTANRGLSPDQLLSLAKELDYRAEISWAACREDGSFDVFFRRRAAEQRTDSTLVAWPQPDTVAEDLTLHVHDPSLFARRQMLIQQVRDYLKATLPESMVPAELIIVSRLPLASNGVTDHTASPPPNLALETKSGAAAR